MISGFEDIEEEEDSRGPCFGRIAGSPDARYFVK